ncbi:hypothetical protein FDP41_011598 [Naegleria fowleri]|uniref:Uncharacterized protein n=1 Tax=Naegleria fowleri TaxID=5763 RepID=A0A6A5CAJ3_NAEFO|nr:uncharacterized protein FDP41_011598 [Naegleria fowleri]KAF0982668.1 hypothetical protein FDP41_011598 [Naegleria fowleri]
MKRQVATGRRFWMILLIIVSILLLLLFIPYLVVQEESATIMIHAHGGADHSHHHHSDHHHHEEEEDHSHHHRKLSSIHSPTTTTTSVKGTDSSKPSTLSVWIYSLASSFGVSLLSLIGASLLFYGCSGNNNRQHSSVLTTPTGKTNNTESREQAETSPSLSSPTGNNLQFILSCVAIGSLLGDCFLHLIPILYASSHDDEEEHDHHGSHQHSHGNNSSSFVILLAFLGCLLIEVYLRVKQQREERNAEFARSQLNSDEDDHHNDHNNIGNRSKTVSHHHHHHHIKAVGWLNLIGDAIHNFMDGAGIAGAFQVSIPVGVANVLCICMHEIPQELSDYGILLSAGFSVKNALFFNFLSGVLSVVGCIFGLLLTSDHGFQFLFMNKNHLIAMSAGSFLYIATSMIPIVLEELVQSDSQNINNEEFITSLTITHHPSDPERKGKESYPKSQFTRKFIYAVSGVLAGFFIMHLIGSYEEYVTNVVSSMYGG